jgi:hypothetical protein
VKRPKIVRVSNLKEFKKAHSIRLVTLIKVHR